MGLLANSFRAIASLGAETKAIAAMAVPTWQQGTPQVPVLSRYSYDQLARKGYMGSEVVFAAVQAVGKSAALPYMVVFDSQEKDADAIYTHPALDVLNRPNKYWTRFQLLNSTVVALKIAGNAYWERVRDQRGKVVEYWPLRPDRMWVIPDEKNYIGGYEYKLGDITYHLKPEDVIHFRNPHPLNDYYGLAPLAVLIERIDIDVWCREFTAAFFRNAGVPSGLLNIQRSVEPNEREILRQRWKQQYGGPDGWGNLLVIDNGQASYTQMGMGPGASGIALTEINQVSESRICMVLDVPPSIIWTVLGHHASSGLNNSNKESDRAQWWQGALVPMYEDIAQQFTLASVDDWTGVDHFSFDLTGVPGGSEDQDKVHARVRADWQAGLVPWHIAAGTLGYPTEEPGWVILPSSVIPTPSEQLAKYTPGQTPPGQPEQPPGGASQGQEQGNEGGGSNEEAGSSGGGGQGGQGNQGGQGGSSGGGSSGGGGGGGRGGGSSGGGGSAGGQGGGGAASGGGGAAGAGAGGEGTKLVAMTISKMTADGQFEIIPGCKVDSMGNHYRSVQLGMCAWCREDPFLLKRANGYDYASTQLNLPDILGKELVQWAKEHIDPDDLGAEGIETQPHVTVKFGLMPTVKPSDVARAVKDQSPVSLSFGTNYVFAGAADPQGGVPLYVSVNSEDLGHLNGVIKRALPNVETYSQYQPHVTIGYIKSDAVNKYVGQRSPLYGMHVTLDDLQFSGADGKQVKIPLGLGLEGKALSEGLDGSGGYMVPADVPRRRNGHTNGNGKRKSSDLFELLDYFRDRFADGFTDFQKAADALQPEPIEVAAWLFNRATGEWPTKTQNGEILSYKAGNIEALLDYWRDRFDGGKPGDFDECVSTLNDKVDDPEALCAWLHHEATGYWPGSAPSEKGDKEYLNGWELAVVDERSELERKLTEQVRQMERALLQSGVAVTPYRPRSQTWLSVLDQKANPYHDAQGRFASGPGGGGGESNGSASGTAAAAGGGHGAGSIPKITRSSQLTPAAKASLARAVDGATYTGTGGNLVSINDGVERGTNWGNGVSTGSAAGTITPENPLGFMGQFAEHPNGTQMLYKTGPVGPNGAPTGPYTAERLATVQDPQVAATIDHVQPAPASEPLTVYAMGGGSAAGKTTLLRTGAVQVPDETHASRVNSDEYKTGRAAKNGAPAIMANPEYAALQSFQHERGAAAVHEESSDTSARAIRESLTSGRHTVIDAVFNHTADKVAQKITEWKGYGVKVVNGAYVTVPVDVAVQRSAARATDPESDSYGRHVPEYVVRDSHISVARMFPEVVRRTAAGELFDNLTLHDTDVPRGQPAKLLISVKPGQKPVIHDRAGYKAFLERGTIPLQKELVELGGEGFPGTGNE